MKSLSYRSIFFLLSRFDQNTSNSKEFKLNLNLYYQTDNTIILVKHIWEKTLLQQEFYNVKVLHRYF